jgi:hypothetical protein
MNVLVWCKYFVFVCIQHAYSFKSERKRKKSKKVALEIFLGKFTRKNAN